MLVRGCPVCRIRPTAWHSPNIPVRGCWVGIRSAYTDAGWGIVTQILVGNSRSGYPPNIPVQRRRVGIRFTEQVCDCQVWTLPTGSGWELLECISTQHTGLRVLGGYLFHRCDMRDFKQPFSMDFRLALVEIIST